MIPFFADYHLLENDQMLTVSVKYGPSTSSISLPFCLWLEQPVIQASTRVERTSFNNILTIFVRFYPREGSSDTHVTGGHQRIGDILLRNMHQLKVVRVAMMTLPLATDSATSALSPGQRHPQDSILLRAAFLPRTAFPSGQHCL